MYFNTIVFGFKILIRAPFQCKRSSMYNSQSGMDTILLSLLTHNVRFIFQTISVSVKELIRISIPSQINQLPVPGSIGLTNGI